jgi:hypothetical protein
MRSIGIRPNIMLTEFYENTYCAALQTLKGKYAVGEPYQDFNGNRQCVVGSMIASDRTVFILAWGVDKADEILLSRVS